MAEGDKEASSSAAQDSQQNQQDPDQAEEGTIVTEGNKKYVIDSEGVRHQIPKMGGCKKLPDGQWIIWSGGIPEASWDGLIKPDPDTINPTQYRPEGISSSIKTRYYRVQGLVTKFSRKSDVLTFQHDVNEHLDEYGMDTIAYLPSPDNHHEMIYVIDHHARCTVREAQQAEQAQKAKYDQYDLTNIMDAKKFLIHSVDESLKKQLYENTSEMDTFITYWMNLMALVGSVSVNRFDKIKNRLKQRTIHQYAGQDVNQLCSAYISDYKELDGGGMYDFNLTLHMLNQIMEAGPEDFRAELRPLRKKLNTQLLKIRHLSYTESKKSLAELELDVNSILKVVKEEYRMLHDEGKWPAASHAKDSKAIGNQYGDANVVSSKPKANTLERSNQGQPRDKSNDTCNNCGEKGHWSRDCPKRNQGEKSQGKDKKGKPNKTKAPFQSPSRKKREPRFPPPGENESEIKIDNGKKWYWCQKCRNWTEHHGTAGHVPRNQLKSLKAQAHVGITQPDYDDQPYAFSVRSKPKVLNTSRS